MDAASRTKPLRIYADTSVFGGCHDSEFRSDSLRMMNRARAGHLCLLISEVVLRELELAPECVRETLTDLPTEVVERVSVTEEVLDLAEAYLTAGILGPKWAQDAAHVAAATVARADAIASWNFKHIVRLDKMKAFNRVNILQGYGLLTIVSPREVPADEGEDKAF